MVKCENLVKIYQAEDIEVLALQGLNLKVDQGELMAIIGASGSGKSTLLNMLGGLDRASAGSLHIGGKNLFKMNAKELCQYRQDTVGFLWQNASRNLLPYLTAEENICLTMTEKSNRKKKSYAHELLKLVGLYERKDHSLQELSGGQQQRIALAISLSNKPKLLLADEPTGALDSKTTQQVLDLLKHFNEELGTTIIIVTHDLELSKNVNRIVSIRDGQVSSEFRKKGSYKKALEEIDSISDNDTEIEEEHVETLVLDSVGRVQLPKEYFQDLKNRKIHHMFAEIKDGKITFEPAETDKT